MKRILFSIVVAAAFGFFAFPTNASAGDHFNGRYAAGYGGYGQAVQQYGGSGCSAYGQSGYGSGYGGGYGGAYRGHNSGYHGGPVQSYVPSYGHGGYGHRGGSYGVSPGYGSGYAPSNNGARGGIHLDIGRFHVLGLGGHH